MRFFKERTRREILAVWGAVVASALYLYFFQNDFILNQINKLRDLPVFWLGAIYLIVSCIRGFTLIPVTYFVLLGMVFLPPVPLFILTMIGVLVSSAVIYYFSEYLHLTHYFEKNHAKEINKLTEILKKYELPIVIGWSFFLFAPTDVLCYVCGTLRVNIKKFLLGIFIGEGAVYFIYIFIGKEFILNMASRVFGL